VASGIRPMRAGIREMRAAVEAEADADASPE
jgi:hypothetical protein